MAVTAIEAAVFLAWARWSLARRSFRDVQRAWLKSQSPADVASPGRECEQAAILGQLTKRVARSLPLHCNCLVQSLALTAMLRRRGIMVDLCIGVRRNGGSEQQIAAHAWVECQGEVVLDVGQNDAFIRIEKL